ncbi:hypothetical protein BC834DRAFT_975774 [Gloeopeniophorella convolvens]|nr:hypothetical protein BC834DRAFT_975774 [Gloeopeniophorella convolvens]
MGLLPATFQTVETIFTFTVLDDFLVDNLECKTTGQTYYSKLQTITIACFLIVFQPDTSSYNVLQGIKEEEGCMAIFCPACPQPGINLPDNFQEIYKLEELVRTFIMDGNFTAEHMRARTSDDEVPLSEGTSFMAEPTRYKEHLSTANHKRLKAPVTPIEPLRWPTLVILI